MGLANLGSQRLEQRRQVSLCRCCGDLCQYLGVLFGLVTALRCLGVVVNLGKSDHGGKGIATSVGNALPWPCGLSSLVKMGQYDLTHSPDECAKIVTSMARCSVGSIVCMTARPLSVNGFLQASQQLERSAYFDLKKGFAESLSAPVMDACALLNAAARAAMDSDWFT